MHAFDAPVAPIKIVVQNTPPAHNGEVFVTGGTLAGQTLSSSAWQVSVAPGAALSGTVQVRTNNVMGANAVGPFGYTWTWGNRTTSITQVNSSIPTGSSTYSVPISLTAPTTPGTYYLLFGFQGEYDCEHVFSATNWSYGSSVWNDGNDYWDMSASALAAAQTLGYAANWTLKFADGMHAFDAPVAPIKIVVIGSTSLANPGFESGAVAWEQSSTDIIYTTTVNANSGSWCAWLGGRATTATNTLSQQFIVPNTAGSKNISFYLKILTTETGNWAYDTLKIQIRSNGGGTIQDLATFSNLDAASHGTYQSHLYDISSYKGQTVQIYLLMNEDYSNATSFWVDDFAVTP